MNTAELLQVLLYLAKRYCGMQTAAASNRTMNHKAVVAQEVTDSLFCVELHESKIHLRFYFCHLIFGTPLYLGTFNLPL